MHAKLLCSAAISGALSLGLAGCGASAGGGSADEIVIGGLLDESGAAAPYGTAALKGAEVAFAQANDDGGIDGRQIEFRQNDGGFDVAQSTGILQRYRTDRDVVAVVGPNSDSVSIPLTERINQSELVAVQTSGATYRPNDEYGEWLFSIPARNDLLIEKVVEELADRGLTRVGVVFSTTRSFAVEAKDDFLDLAADSGLEVIGKPIGYDDADVDFSTVVTALGSRKGLEAVFCSCLPAAAGPMISKATDSGLDVQWASDASLLNPSFYELSQATADGTLLATPFAESLRNPTVTAFVEDFREMHGQEPDLYAAYGYDAALALVKALKSIEGEISREVVRDALASVRFDGATGTITFPDGQGVASREDVHLVEMDDGKFVPLSK